MFRYLNLPALVLTLAAIASAQNIACPGITRHEVELLIGEIAKSNPEAVKRLTADPSMKMKQIDQLKQLLAFSCQARRDGLAGDPINSAELDNILIESKATRYGRSISQPDTDPFAAITDDEVKKFYTIPANDAAFQKFLNAKLKLIERDDPNSKPVTDEEKQQARDVFARIRIYAKTYDDKKAAKTLATDLIERTDVEVRLQQAQFLAKLFAEKAVVETTPTNADVEQYISSHPEFDLAAKRKKAEDVLGQAVAGADFATLANKYTDDPGNIGGDNKPQGGLYAGVQKGQMVPEFETAALALSPGQISPKLVESDFGYHIIKLEKKTEVKNSDGTSTVVYDVRHILISTMVKDPSDPQAGSLPIHDYVKQKLAYERSKKLTDDVMASTNVSVPSDYTIPPVSLGTGTGTGKPAEEPAATAKKPATTTAKKPAAKRPAAKRPVKH